jgi:hypothetical protein
MPRSHIKTVAGTDFTSKHGLPFPEQAEKTFGSILVANCTFGKECWQSSIFNLHNLSSKSGS